MIRTRKSWSEEEDHIVLYKIKDNIFWKYFEWLGGLWLSSKLFFNYQPALITHLLKKRVFVWLSLYQNHKGDGTSSSPWNWTKWYMIYKLFRYTLFDPFLFWYYQGLERNSQTCNLHHGVISMMTSQIWNFWIPHKHTKI